MARKALGKTRVIISLPPDTLRRLDEVASAALLTRTDAVKDAVERYIKQEEKPSRTKRKT
jgi:metal-responsive CopG/Arc/MetJ family transcriptional regulator